MKLIFHHDFTIFIYVQDHPKISMNMVKLCETHETPTGIVFPCNCRLRGSQFGMAFSFAGEQGNAGPCLLADLSTASVHQRHALATLDGRPGDWNLGGVDEGGIKN